MCGDHGQKQSQQQLDLQNRLQQQAIAKQDALRSQIMGGVGKYLNGSGEGFDPATMAMLQSQFLNQNNANFNGARSDTIAALQARGAYGGNTPAGTDLARQFSGLEGARATSQSQGILGLGIQNLQQAINNRFNAANIASGQTAQLGQNVGIFGQGANNSLDQYVRAKSVPGFMSTFAQGLGQGLGGLATMGIGSGAGSALSNIGKILGRGSSQLTQSAIPQVGAPAGYTAGGIS